VGEEGKSPEPVTEEERGQPLGEGHLPEPSIWPMVLAVGVTLLLFGVVTTLVFSIFGALLMVTSTHGWIQELRHA
jgi:Cytochrome c oxidase subunit IV